MENKIMMPASYNVLSCEEMTYTEGGATVGQALAAWFWPGYATVIGINTCREARKKDHDNWVSNVWNDIKADCKGNVTNTFYHAGIDPGRGKDEHQRQQDEQNDAEPGQNAFFLHKSHASFGSSAPIWPRCRWAKKKPTALAANTT